MFSLFLYNGELLVSHDSLGEYKVPTNHALIVALKRTPNKVYVSAGTDL